MSLNFNQINLTLQTQTTDLIKKWLPGGDIIGNDYCPLNPTRADKHKGSFRINRKTGQWHDFATGDKGANLISLYAYINGITLVESANILINKLNMKGHKNMNTLTYNEDVNYETILLPQSSEYKGFDNATNSWAYRNIEGQILIIADRFNYSNGSKTVLPRCFVRNVKTNEKGWLQKKLLTYNPLYNMENFNDQRLLPILIVEGEKTCEAAKNIYGNDFWCTTWFGGAQGVKKAQIESIAGRTIYLLPDNDKPGKTAMNQLYHMLKDNNDVYFVDYPETEFPLSWDIADELPCGWSYSRLKEYILDSQKFKSIINKAPENNSNPNSLTTDVVPYPQPVNGIDLVNKLIDTIKKYVIVNNHEAIAIAYWILQTYNANAFTYAPRLLLISPEKRCGKSTLLHLLEMLSYRSYFTGNCTPAVLFKIIEKEQPTMLIDEADSFFKTNNDMKNIINNGFKVGGNASRSGGKNYEDIKKYNVFSMMAIAAINDLPDTIMDRGIKINMRRKLKSEKVLPLRERLVSKEFDIIKQKCRRFMLESGKQASEYLLSDIDELNDRAIDLWESLVGIASVIGDTERVINAAIKITSNNDNDCESLKTLLLKHILQIFAAHNFSDMSSSTLVSNLLMVEDSPWAEINNGRAITQHKLSYLLKEYKISTFQKNIGGNNTKHYSFDAFIDAFERYIPKEYNKAMLEKENYVESLFDINDKSCINF